MGLSPLSEPLLLLSRSRAGNTSARFAFPGDYIMPNDLLLVPPLLHPPDQFGG